MKPGLPTYWNSRCSDLDSLLGAQPVWLKDAYSTYRITDVSPGYQRHFETSGHREGNNWLTGIDRSGVDPDEGLTNLAKVLRAFRRQAWTGPKWQTLLVFVGPPDSMADLARGARSNAEPAYIRPLTYAGDLPGTHSVNWRCMGAKRREFLASSEDSSDAMLSLPFCFRNGLSNTELSVVDNAVR
jgi:hypothetical protein